MMACWRKWNTEEVIIITAGGGCYVSREEGWGNIRMAGVSFCLLVLLCLHSSFGRAAFVM